MIASGGRRVALAALALAATVACTHGRPVRATADPCTGPGADTTGWQVVDAGPFRFSVPRGYERRTVRGIDSHVGVWSAGGQRAVHFDWGQYSSTLDEAAALLRGHVECTVEIGGHRVKVVSGFDFQGRWNAEGQKHVVAATWRDVEPDAHLTLSATAADASEIPALLSIIRSVRFHPGTPVR